ncbi:unnamed protein product [Calypogeia fissa]
MFLNPMFCLNAKVKDVWNLQKVFVHDLVGAKARLVYPVKPSSPHPRYLPEFLEVVKHVVLPRNGMTAWDSLMNLRQAKILRTLVRAVGRGNLLGMWLRDYKKDLGELELDVHDVSDGEDVLPYDIAPKPYRPRNDTRRLEEEHWRWEGEAQRPTPADLAAGMDSSAAPSKRRPGRPHKYPIGASLSTKQSVGRPCKVATPPVGSPEFKRGRGRPRKNPLPPNVLSPIMQGKGKALKSSKALATPPTKKKPIGEGPNARKLEGKSPVMEPNSPKAMCVDDTTRQDSFSTSSHNGVVDQPMKVPLGENLSMGAHPTNSMEELNPLSEDSVLHAWMKGCVDSHILTHSPSFW